MPGENGITRREFDASIEPIREDVKEIRKDIEKIENKMATHSDVGKLDESVSRSIGQWTTTNSLFQGKQHELERKIAFAQGAVAVLGFLVGAGFLGSILLLLVQP